MTDILRPLDKTPVAIKTRSYRVEINNPSIDAIPTVRFRQEEIPVDLDGNAAGEAVRIESITASMATLAGQSVTLADGTVLNGAQVAEAIELFYLDLASE